MGGRSTKPLHNDFLPEDYTVNHSVRLAEPTRSDAASAWLTLTAQDYN